MQSTHENALQLMFLPHKSRDKQENRSYSWPSPMRCCSGPALEEDENYFLLKFIVPLILPLYQT